MNYSKSSFHIQPPIFILECQTAVYEQWVFDKLGKHILSGTLYLYYQCVLQSYRFDKLFKIGDLKFIKRQGKNQIVLFLLEGFINPANLSQNQCLLYKLT